ncbi:hypothetical protein GFK26_11380 [Variovorax paradoxus]|uniref:Uncharacterized protein n=1 Tax=Variovorax paradoxus TaxID=34073 RepID=A0A5Q0M4F0_VARPD|nr:hypothetical protein [Variovorax paradoxus]QFZ83322.1 hypothetical protein GFK26_11380 [Variovorax paradoxus]
MANEGLPAEDAAGAQSNHNARGFQAPAATASPPTANRGAAAGHVLHQRLRQFLLQARARIFLITSDQKHGGVGKQKTE